jgi:Proteolysis_6 C-terminal
MSREKLLSKLLLSIQAFTYSCCCEAFEARRSFRRITYLSTRATKASPDITYSSVLSRFGIANVACDGKVIHMPIPTVEEEKSSPFDGRLGKLRCLALTVMAAAGAVAADLVQLALPFPSALRLVDSTSSDHGTPLRAPVAYPILLGHVLTHVVAAMCASCGLARARNDSLEVVWPVTFSARGSLISNKESDNKIDAVLDDCEGFLKLGLLARLLQSLLGTLYLKLDSIGIGQTFASIEKVLDSGSAAIPPTEVSWINWCISLLKIACSSADSIPMEADSVSVVSADVSIDVLRESCSLAASAGCTFVADAWVIMQILMPGIATKIQSNDSTKRQSDDESAPHEQLERLLNYLKLESLNNILDSVVVSDVLSDWYRSATQHAKFDSQQGTDAVSEWYRSAKQHGKDVTGRKQGDGAIEASLQSMLFRTQGFRVVDWPNTGSAEDPRSKVPKLTKQESFKIVSTEAWPQDDAMQIESISNAGGERSSISNTIRSEVSRPVLTFSTKKTVSLIGGYPRDLVPSNKGSKSCPCVVAMPTSYTDLYATLCSLMPDCEQTAVCLVCGEVLNACGKGECTNHTNRCGAGAGMFFLLQECTGLIMHQKKAAYIHSPYVDSHGETPQYRGRPLNLDLERYEHLREIWYTHSVRQKVIAERGSSRQVIQIDFY